MENVIGRGKFRKLVLLKNEDVDGVVEREYERLELFLLQENQDDESIKIALNFLRRSHFWWKNKD